MPDTRHRDGMLADSQGSPAAAHTPVLVVDTTAAEEASKQAETTVPPPDAQPTNPSHAPDMQAVDQLPPGSVGATSAPAQERQQVVCSQVVE